MTRGNKSEEQDLSDRPLKNLMKSKPGWFGALVGGAIGLVIGGILGLIALILGPLFYIFFCLILLDRELNLWFFVPALCCIPVVVSTQLGAAIGLAIGLVVSRWRGLSPIWKLITVGIPLLLIAIGGIRLVSYLIRNYW